MSVTHMSQEAEESLLGAIILAHGGQKAAEEVVGIVDPGDFYLAKNGTLFGRVMEMHQRGEVVDPVTVAAELERHGELEKIGGTGKLIELSAATPSASQAKRYAEIVRDKAVLRGLWTAAAQMQMAVDSGGKPTDEIVALAEQYLSEAVSKNTRHTAVSITSGLDEMLAELRESIKTGVIKTGVLTHIERLDAMLAGLWPGQFVLLAARPGVGKSTLAQNIAENVVDRTDGRVLFVTLEMGLPELLNKALSRAGKIDGTRLQNHRITQDEQKQMADAVKLVRARADRLLVDDTGVSTVSALAAEAIRLHRQGGLSLIVVDYIQLMQGQGDTKAEQVGSISRGLKLLARRLNVPILGLSQMNRAIIHRAEKRPDMSDLRDSGSLEQDADVVIFLHKESDFDMDKEDDGTVELIVAKNRRGMTGSENVLFLKRFGSFVPTTDKVKVT